MRNQTMAWAGLGAALAIFATPVRADEKGERLLREACRKLNEAQSMTATLTRSYEGEGVNKKLVVKGLVSAMKPNLLLVRITRQTEGEKSETVYAATGKDYVTYNSFDKSYSKNKLDANPTEFSGEWEAEIDAFFGGEKLLAKGTADYAGMDKVGDAPCNVVKMKIKATNKEPERVITYFIGQKDRLIHKTSWILRDAETDMEFTEANTMTDINLKAIKKADDFQYTPPRDAKPKAPDRDVI